MEGYLWTGLGMVAGVCTTACFVPQVVKIWREGDTEAISKRMYVVSVAAFGLWTAHGILIGSAPVVIFNALNVLLTATILVLKMRGRSAAAA